MPFEKFSVRGVEIWKTYCTNEKGKLKAEHAFCFYAHNRAIEFLNGRLVVILKAMHRD